MICVPVRLSQQKIILQISNNFLKQKIGLFEICASSILRRCSKYKPDQNSQLTVNTF